METRLEDFLKVLTEKGDALEKARDHVAQLADQHSILKELAIIRVMKRDGISSNAANTLARSDPAFMEHCTEQRNASIAVIRSETEYEVAKARVTQASLITPSMIELQTKIKKLDLDVKIQKQERENAENGRANANRMLAERIQDVDALTQRNRRFWAQIDLLAPRPLEVYDAWETASARRATAIPFLTTPPGPHERPGDVMASGRA